MKRIELTIVALAGTLLCGGCATPITHLYDGTPLPIEKVGQMEGANWQNCKSPVPVTITAVDGKDVHNKSQPYAVLPGTHTLTAYGGDAIMVVADTGISTSPEMRTSKDMTLWCTITGPGRTPVTIAWDDKRVAQARQDLQSNTLRTVSFAAEAGKKYVVRCELTKDYKLTERGVWIEELAGSKSK